VQSLPEAVSSNSDNRVAVLRVLARALAHVESKALLVNHDFLSSYVDQEFARADLVPIPSRKQNPLPFSDTIVVS
jgi:hypothetical protein